MEIVFFNFLMVQYFKDFLMEMMVKEQLIIKIKNNTQENGNLSKDMASEN